MKHVYFFSYMLLGPPLSVSHGFFFCELFDVVYFYTLLSIFSFICQSYFYLEAYHLYVNLCVKKISILGYYIENIFP